LVLDVAIPHGHAPGPLGNVAGSAQIDGVVTVTPIEPRLTSAVS
jgi:hypothetical protein